MACGELSRTGADVSRGRLHWLLVGFVVACCGVMGRLAALDLIDGDELRAEASRPAARTVIVPALRGRILARDGSVLAFDQPLAKLAVQYRMLQDPLDAHWLRATARARLSAHERRQSQRVADEEQRVLAERADMLRRLADLCGLTSAEWSARVARLQQRVERIAALANQRVLAPGPRPGESDAIDPSIQNKILSALFRAPEDPPAPITVAEELQEQVIVEGLSLDAVTEIEEHPELYPGVKIVYGSRRIYPHPNLAPHVLGYVSRGDSAGEHNGPAARSGVEQQYDQLLRGAAGETSEQIDRRGRVIATTVHRKPQAGRDLILTLDPNLQRTAQELLDQALARRIAAGPDSVDRASGGAIVAIDVRNGAVLAAASAPRFDCQAMNAGDAERVREYLADPGHPLFDRCIQMALPPGSVFKSLTAVALLHQAGFDPQKPWNCQGYLQTPDRRRCMIYRRLGVGHGPVTLVDALAQSCNTYFFHYGAEFGPAPLFDWGRRFGFGEPTNIDLPSESAGHLPSFALPFSPRPTAGGALTEDAESLAVGQGALTVTPLQAVRMMAAIANGGQLVTPHVATRLGLPTSDDSDARNASGADDGLDIPPPRPIAGLDPAKLALAREGLRRVVADETGTAHAIEVEGIEIAGKTGTAECGPGQTDHAWFAGYAPAAAPHVAFVIVLEHAGTASTIAVPVARRLVESLRSRGYLP